MASPTIKCSWEEGGVQRFYNSSTFETVHVNAPLWFKDDFLGVDGFLKSEAGSFGIWGEPKIVGAAPPTVATGADAAGGTVLCSLTADAQKQDAWMYFADQLLLDVTKDLNIEMRCRLTTLPTLVAEACFGLSSNWADGPDTITHCAWFTADGSGEIFMESDNAATDNSATSGVTATAAQTKIYRIKCVPSGSNAVAHYYIDGVHVGGGSSYPLSGTQQVQPFLGLYKAAGAGLGVLTIDYVAIWASNR